MSNCSSCGTAFVRTSNKSAKCSDCLKARTRAWHQANPERGQTYRKKYYEENKAAVLKQQKERYLAQTFGLAVEDYEAGRSAAKHCSICLGTFDVQGPQLDHCHTTGRVRDWLCARCNRGIGMFDDSIEKLKQAINYLEKHAGKV